MLPQSGPIAFSIPGISGVSVPAATTGAEVKYRWPVTVKLVGIDFCIRSGVNVQLAKTKLRMVDDQNIVLATDGQGNVESISGLVNRGIPSFFALVGGGRVNAFQRIVRQGDIWVFQIINGNGGGVAVVPELFFRVEPAVTVLEGRAA